MNNTLPERGELTSYEVMSILPSLIEFCEIINKDRDYGNDNLMATINILGKNQGIKKFTGTHLLKKFNAFLKEDPIDNIESIYIRSDITCFYLDRFKDNRWSFIIKPVYEQIENKKYVTINESLESTKDNNKLDVSNNLFTTEEVMKLLAINLIQLQRNNLTQIPIELNITLQNNEKKVFQGKSLIKKFNQLLNHVEFKDIKLIIIKNNTNNFYFEQVSLDNWLYKIDF